MNKINIEDLEQILVQQVDDAHTRSRIIQTVRDFLSEQDTEPTEQEPKPETRNLTILMGSEEALRNINVDELSAFTVQIADDSDHNTLIAHLVQKARDYNQQAKRRSSHIRRLGEVFDTLKPKKHCDMFPRKIYTKESSLILKTPNLPITPQNVDG
jgi:predicted secreted protein